MFVLAFPGLNFSHNHESESLPFPSHQGFFHGFVSSSSALGFKTYSAFLTSVEHFWSLHFIGAKLFVASASSQSTSWSSWSPFLQFSSFMIHRHGYFMSKAVYVYILFLFLFVHQRYELGALVVLKMWKKVNNLVFLPKVACTPPNEILKIEKGSFVNAKISLWNQRSLIISRKPLHPTASVVMKGKQTHCSLPPPTLEIWGLFLLHLTYSLIKPTRTEDWQEVKGLT